MLKPGKITHEMYWADGTPEDPNQPLPEEMLQVIAEILAPMVFEEIEKQRKEKQEQAK